MPHGITFGEVMAGPFALGKTDPEAGRAQGETDGTRLIMTADVSIADLDAFIADPDHPGGLAGTVDFEPLGTGLRAREGIFNLFSPGGDPDLKLMVYELGFEVDGRPYYLAGRKEVRDDAGFDLWSDTTTLYTTLHDGGDKTAPVAGAGVLALGMRDLAELLSTLRVTGTDSPVEIAATLGKFGGFFMGQLWDSYGPEALKLATLSRRK